MEGDAQQAADQQTLQQILAQQSQINQQRAGFSPSHANLMAQLEQLGSTPTQASMNLPPIQTALPGVRPPGTAGTLPSFNSASLAALGLAAGGILPGNTAQMQQAQIQQQQAQAAMFARAQAQQQQQHLPMQGYYQQQAAMAPARKTGSRSSGPHKKQCNCKNSRCLKLYCECFASGRYCENCNCVNCYNNRENETTRQHAVEAILDRNPNAFRPKIQITEAEAARQAMEGGGGPVRHSKGCNCKKSTCLKKYCECYQAGIYCMDNCKCVDCKNFEGSESRAAVMAADGLVPAGQLHMQQQFPPAFPSFTGQQMAQMAHMQNMNQSQAAQATAKKQKLDHGGASGSFGILGPGGRPLTLSDPGMQGALAALQTTQQQQRTNLHSVVHEMVKRNVIEELCQLLLLVAADEAQRSGPNSPEAQLAADVANKVLTVAIEAGSNNGEPDPDKPPPSKLYEAQEKVVLEEFLSILQKITNTAPKKVEPEPAGAATTSSLAALLMLGSGAQPSPQAPQQQMLALPPADPNQAGSSSTDASTAALLASMPDYQALFSAVMGTPAADSTNNPALAAQQVQQMQALLSAAAAQQQQYTSLLAGTTPGGSNGANGLPGDPGAQAAAIAAAVAQLGALADTPVGGYGGVAGGQLGAVGGELSVDPLSGLGEAGAENGGSTDGQQQ